MRKPIEKSAKIKKDSRVNSTVIIRWNLIDELIKQGLNGKQIAAKYSISYDTLVRRCKTEKDCGFADYIRNFPYQLIEEWEKPDPKQKGKTIWQLIDLQMETGAPGTEIAAYYDVDADLFYKLFQKYYGRTFSEMQKIRKKKGQLMIRSKQFQAAMGGNGQMLMHLGKNLLEQTDQLNINVKARVLTPEEMPDFIKKLDDEF